uniref:Amidinotransferase n=1 Tax=Ascaris suum TaxID=6253 RepID=F1LDR8_ASCSU
MAPAMTFLKRIFMCRPTFFKVSYSINPWMDVKNAVNHDVAMKQWESLKATIERCGASVEVLEPIGADRFPDIVFTANAAVIRKRTAYLANFYYPERQGERDYSMRSGSAKMAMKLLGTAIFLSKVLVTHCGVAVTKAYCLLVLVLARMYEHWAMWPISLTMAPVSRCLAADSSISDFTTLTLASAHLTMNWRCSSLTPSMPSVVTIYPMKLDLFRFPRERRQSVCL